MTELMIPSERVKASFIDAIREFQAEERYGDYDLSRLDQHFDAFVADLLRRRDTPRPGKVAETILWLADGDVFLGRVSIRHELNDRLRQFGGHIGYDVRPSMRRRGYGTLILRLALPHARAIGITRALLTCDSTNDASRRIIQANGGMFADETLLEGHIVPTQRWWIDLGSLAGQV